MEYSEEEIAELRSTFQLYDRDNSGKLEASELQKCVEDLSYNYNAGFINHIVAGQIQPDNKTNTLGFEEFVGFVDVISAIDGYVFEHCQGLLSNLPNDKLQSLKLREKVESDSDLISKLSPMVQLKGDDEFDFSDINAHLGIEPSNPDQDEIAKTEEAPSNCIQESSLKSSSTNSVEPSSANLSVPGVERPRQQSTFVSDNEHEFFQEHIFDFTQSQSPESKPKRPLNVEIPNEQNLPLPLPTMNNSPIEQHPRFSVLSPASEQLKQAPEREHETNESQMQMVVSTDRLLDDEDFEFDEEDEDYIREAFQTFLQVFDTDGDETIAADELGSAMRALGLDPSEEDLHKLFDRADIDRSGSIDFNEFRIYYKELFKMQIRDGVPLNQMATMFERAESNGNGEVSRDEFAHLLRVQCPKLSEQRVGEIVDAADTNGDGSIELDEFIAFICRKDSTSRLFARKLLRAQLPSPIEHLTAFGRMPSTFRSSALAEYDFVKENTTSFRMGPHVDEQSGLSYKDLELDTTLQQENKQSDGVLRPPKAVDAVLWAQIEVQMATGIPIPAVKRELIKARRLRVMLFDADAAVSNQIVLRASWMEAEEDCWRFGGMRWNCFLAKSARPQTYLLFELTMLVENESPRTPQDSSKSSSVTEMTCGFATLDLLGGNFLKTTTETLQVMGGTFKAQSAIKSGEVLARRAGWRRLTKLFKGKPLPSLLVKVSSPTKLLKAHANILPNDLLTPTAFVQVHERARFLLAAELLKEKQLKSEAKVQNIALALFLGAIVDHCDALQALADRWETCRKRLKRSERTQLALLNARFASAVVSLHNGLASTSLPDAIVGVNELERLTLLRHCSAYDSLKALSSDGVQKRAVGAPQKDIAECHLYRPFHTDELVFVPDQLSENVFGALEQRLRHQQQQQQ